MIVLSSKQGEHALALNRISLLLIVHFNQTDDWALLYDNQRYIYKDFKFVSKIGHTSHIEREKEGNRKCREGLERGREREFH